jgi:hypothetical protein
MKLQTRVEPVVTEVITNFRSEEETEVKDSLLMGLGEIVKGGGKGLGESIWENVIELMKEGWSEKNGSSAGLENGYAALVAGVVKWKGGDVCDWIR